MLKGYFKFKYMTLYFFKKKLYLNFLTKRVARALHDQLKLMFTKNQKTHEKCESYHKFTLWKFQKLTNFHIETQLAFTISPIFTKKSQNYPCILRECSLSSSRRKQPLLLFVQHSKSFLTEFSHMFTKKERWVDVSARIKILSVRLG